MAPAKSTSNVSVELLWWSMNKPNVIHSRHAYSVILTLICFICDVGSSMKVGVETIVIFFSFSSFTNRFRVWKTALSSTWRHTPLAYWGHTHTLNYWKQPYIFETRFQLNLGVWGFTSILNQRDLLSFTRRRAEGVPRERDSRRRHLHGAREAQDGKRQGRTLYGCGG